MSSHGASDAQLSSIRRAAQEAVDSGDVPALARTLVDEGTMRRRSPRCRLRQRLFEPLGMRDTDFWIPPAKRGRMAQSYSSPAQSEFARVDIGAFVGAGPPEYASGGQGLVSTADDYLAFARMLVQGGRAARAAAVVGCRDRAGARVRPRHGADQRVGRRVRRLVAGGSRQRLGCAVAPGVSAGTSGAGQAAFAAGSGRARN
jgi:CubicO group peptidase (beta-lactamase class C family)